MPLKQSELAKRFARGDDPDDIPDASNVTARTHTDDDVEAVIVGYGHAAYAARMKTGEIVLFNGWRGYSPSTTCQMTELRKGFRRALDPYFDAQVVQTPDDGQPKIRDAGDAARRTGEVHL